MLVSMDFVGGPVGGVDYPRTYQEFRAWFPDDCFVCGVFGPFALARRFSVPVVRPRSGVANLDPALEVRELRAQDLGDRRNDLSSHPNPVEHMVRCNLADHLTEERRGGQESARHSRFGRL